jgi:hypothetical protein
MQRHCERSWGGSVRSPRDAGMTLANAGALDLVRVWNMKIAIWLTALTALTAVAVIGCTKDESVPDAAPSRSATDAALSPAPSASTAASAPAPSASAIAPRSDCPKGSSGGGTFDKPCEANKSARLMEATWTGKTDDKGPQFRITNKSTLAILYGKIAVYFYDKAGKQLEVTDASGKTHPFQSCAGNLFGGVMHVGEKAVMTLSCVKKEHVPDHTAAVEAELQMVGFADASEKASSFYWRNDDLAPEARKKGGVK